MPAPAFRSFASAIDQTTGTFSVSRPSGTANGDLLIAAQTTFLSGGGLPAPPNGSWTPIASFTFGGAGYTLQVWYRIADGEPASWTFNNAGGASSKATALVEAWSGASTDAPVVTTNDGSGLTMTALGITTSTDESILQGLFCPVPTLATITVNGFTVVGSIGGGGTDMRIALGYRTLTPAAASGDKTADLSLAVDWGALLMSIGPAPAKYARPQIARGPYRVGAPWLPKRSPPFDVNPPIIPVPTTADMTPRPKIAVGPAFPGSPWSFAAPSVVIPPTPPPPVPPVPPTYIGNDKTFIAYWPQQIAVVEQDGELVVPIDSRLRRSSEILADINNSLMRQGQLIKTGLNTWSLNVGNIEPFLSGLTEVMSTGGYGTLAGG